MFEERAFVYKTEFSDGRESYHDLVVASNEGEAHEKALNEVRGIDDAEYGCDPNAEIEIICVLATDPSSLNA